MASVKVAVRVRPFNQREIGMSALSIIEMDGKKTRICNNKQAMTLKQDCEGSREKYKDFTFDYSYWSFDAQDAHFASQEQVFKDLGMDVVGNAFQGYNACVFAYGQTGSGKTHTMMGTQTPQDCQGLIPRICQDMFNRMFQDKQKGTTYRTEVSYLEIYNESVKDLLKKDQTHNLRVREHPKHGPYVEDLSKHLVMSYNDIQGLMNRGNANRTTACTNMNDVSSRSHAIFTMTFVQARFVGDMPSETVSKVHLVDLAGSERADTSGATGQRLKEGAHINKSLVTLGSVISALAESSQAQLNKNSHKTFIPYRDSVLTWLLKDSLGGNSKTIMIATISPADCNYGETLSTLRYANRAKNIINKPTINEDTNVKLIRELRAEINKLKLLLGSNVDSIDVHPEVLEELHQKEAKEKSLTEEWTEKWKETQKILLEQKDLALRKAGTGVVLDSQMPHLIGIDDDLLSTGITLYHLKQGQTRIGSEGGNEKHDITLNGLGLEAQHCSIMLESGIATLVPNNGSVCWVNGQQIDKPTRLSQGCVILLGRTSMFRYNDPAEAEKLRRDGSRSHLNLSRLSFLSRSATDLAWSSENLNSTAIGEENTLLEEKRKQLEAEEARLQKESEELLRQKQQLEQQKNTYQQLQQEKEEAWKAEQLNKSSDIHLAQKELEERRHKLELEYAAHRRRLAEDWKRLEEQEQDTLANLQSKEADLKKRREFLEWEVDQEMEQIESEASKVETLKESLENKQREVNKLTNQFNEELQKLLDKPNEDLKHMLVIEDNEVRDYLAEHSKKIEEWKSNSIASLAKEREVITQKLKEVVDQIQNCEDPNLLASYEKQRQDLETEESKKMTDLLNLNDAYKKKMDKLASSSSLLKEYRDIYNKTNQEFVALNDEIEKGIGSMNASEAKIGKLESDLALIAGQEKLIVSQLANIDSSKQKLLTIIENSTEGLESETQANGKSLSSSDLISNEIESRYNSKPNSDNKVWNITVSKSGRSDLPNEINGNERGHIPDVIPSGEMKASPDESAQFDEILQVVSPPPALFPDITNEEAAVEINRLFQEVSQQKTIVLECLENDCEKEELNKHLELLQDLVNRYNVVRSNAKVRQEWLNFDEDDTFTFDFDKTGADSELDDSEAHSSVTDHDDHIQLLVDQEVERRLRKIIEQLKAGQKPDILRGAGMSNRTFRRSLPSGLNTYASGSDDDGSTASGHSAIPRSQSVNSTTWAAVSLKEGAIPGVLDIRIGSFCQRGSGVSTHFQYEILIVTQNDRWTVLRRYNRFRDLYKQMRKKYGLKVANIPFPPKIFFKRKSEDVARQRQASLELFLQSLISVCSSMPTCPLNRCEPLQVKDALIAFSAFFEKGFFESTKYGTS